MFFRVIAKTTACEKPLFEYLFVFEHFFYSSAIFMLKGEKAAVNNLFYFVNKLWKT